MLSKQIIILNGSGGVGKDTFISILNKYLPTVKYSIVDPIKEYLDYMGVPRDNKSEKARKAMSDIKLFLEQWDIPYTKVEDMIADFICSPDYIDKPLLSIDMREPHDIERAVNEYYAITVLVTNDRIKQITSNIADANVYNYTYDYTVENNGTLEDLENEAKKFIEWLFQNRCNNTEIDTTCIKYCPYCEDNCGGFYCTKNEK